MRVYLEPKFDRPDQGEGGIRRLVEAQRKYLPQFGVELVDDINKAEITAGHGGTRPIRAGVPFVSHSHGLYWRDYTWDHHEDAVNPVVIEALLAADAITVPSQWVRNAYARGILRDPKVIYHGVELADWTPAPSPGNYVLWNKPRHDAVSNVNDMMALARRMPDISFMATLGNNASNIKLIGRVPYAQMKAYIEGAGVYLATARETFGIGTLEALACGVPVAGWNYGGQREIVVNGETGYLAEYGDYAGLDECVRKCFAERARLSANCREDVRKRWGWLDKIEQYAALYQCVLHQRTDPRPKVSVIVTCHNLAKYLPDALNSVISQTLADWECIIVDDASTDDTKFVAGHFNDARIRFVRSDTNLKLSGARNYGFARARGRYVINLDADDQLGPNALQVLADALDHNPHLHIAYGSLDLMDADGANRRRNPFPGPFNWLGQMAHLNQSHYAAMMRREVWEQTGGYRDRMWRAEDAEFWCRATSFGFRAAKVTEETTLVWRFRPDGKSATERKTYPDIDGDWTHDFPWSIAHNMRDGIAAKEGGFRIARWDTVPFGAPVKDAPVWHRESPLVSVIIPLGAGHERCVIDALDSCVAQTMHNWEVIVVNDTGDPDRRIPGAPYVRMVSTGGKQGPGHARNVGIANARAPLVLFLDADDYLDPTALEQMIGAYKSGNAGYVYSGWTVIRPDNTTLTFDAKPYSRENWLLGKAEGRNIVTVLMATEHARQIGFDEAMIGYEDWDFFCKCAVEGICGVPVDAPLVTYRWIAGQRSVKAGEHRTELVKEIRERYAGYLEGSKQMAKCCGGNKKAVDAILAARSGVVQQTAQVAGMTVPVKPGHVRMQFIGERQAPVTYHVNGHAYSGGLMEDWRFVDALEGDVQRLEQMGVWKKVRPPAPQPVPVPAAPTPEPLPVPVAPPPVAPMVEAHPIHIVPVTTTEVVTVPAPKQTAAEVFAQTGETVPQKKRGRKARAK